MTKMKLMQFLRVIFVEEYSVYTESDRASATELHFQCTSGINRGYIYTLTVIVLK